MAQGQRGASETCARLLALPLGVRHDGGTPSVLSRTVMTYVGDERSVGIRLVPGPPGFCGMELSLNGRRLGEPELYAPSATLAAQLASFRSRAAARVSPSLFARSARDCLDTIHHALFDLGEERTLEESWKAGETFGPFLLSPDLCESLDAYFIVVMSDGTEQRVIARTPGNADVIEARFSEGRLEQVFGLAEQELSTS